MTFPEICCAIIGRCAKFLIKYERVTGDQFVAVYNGADMDEVMGKKTEEAASEAADTAADAETPVSETEEENA